MQTHFTFQFGQDTPTEFDRVRESNLSACTKYLSVDVAGTHVFDESSDTGESVLLNELRLAALQEVKVKAEHLLHDVIVAVT